MVLLTAWAPKSSLADCLEGFHVLESKPLGESTTLGQSITEEEGGNSSSPQWSGAWHGSVVQIMQMAGSGRDGSAG